MLLTCSIAPDCYNKPKKGGSFILPLPSPGTQYGSLTFAWTRSTIRPEYRVACESLQQRIRLCHIREIQDYRHLLKCSKEVGEPIAHILYFEAASEKIPRTKASCAYAFTVQPSGSYATPSIGRPPCTRSGQCCSKVRYFARGPPVRKMRRIYPSFSPFEFSAQTQ